MLSATHAPWPLDKVNVAVPIPTALILKVCALAPPAGKLSVRRPLIAPWGTATLASLLVTVTAAGELAFRSLGIVTVIVLVVCPTIAEREAGTALTQGRTFSIFALSNTPVTASPVIR